MPNELTTPAGDPTVAGGTGHRRIPRGSLAWVTERTRAAAVWLATERGMTAGISGFADGWDLIWADAILRADMDLWAAIPYEEQPARFTSPYDRADWHRLRGLAAREWVCGSIAGLTGKARGRRANQLLWQRNATIVDQSSYMVCCWDPARVEHCGTYNAIVYARARGRGDQDGMHIDPAAPQLRMRLPGGPA